MEKREDCWWRESTLGEDVDVKVGTYLRANHQEYQEIRHQIDELIQQYPAVRALFESEDAVTLTAEEHKALIRYFCLESSVEMIEREYHFYMGQSMMYSYGTMLTSIRNSVLGEKSVLGEGAKHDGYLTDHLLNLIAEGQNRTRIKKEPPAARIMQLSRNMKERITFVFLATMKASSKNR